MKSEDHPSFVLSVASLVAGLTSTLNRWGKQGGNGVKNKGTRAEKWGFPPRQYQYSCWLLLLGFLLDLADGAVARQLDACSALGECIPPAQG